MRFLTLAALTLGLLIGGASQSNANYVIDNFSDTGPSVALLTDGIVTQLQTDGGVGGAYIEGGSRDVNVDFSPAGPGGPPLGTGLVILSRVGGINFSNQLLAGGNPIHVQVTYDGLGVPGPGLGGVDLTNGGSNFQISLTGGGGGVAPLAVTMTVYDSVSATSASHVFVLPGVLGSSTLTTSIAGFAGDTGVFDSATKITLDFVLDKSLGNDQLFLDNLEATVVPEPSSIALLGLGAMGLIGYARRRAKGNKVA